MEINPTTVTLPLDSFVSAEQHDDGRLTITFLLSAEDAAAFAEWLDSQTENPPDDGEPTDV